MGRDFSCDSKVRMLKAKSTSFGKPDVRDLTTRSYLRTDMSTTGAGVGVVLELRGDGWEVWKVGTELPSWSSAAPDVEAGPYTRSFSSCSYLSSSLHFVNRLNIHYQLATHSRPTFTHKKKKPSHYLLDKMLPYRVRGTSDGGREIEAPGYLSPLPISRYLHI